MNRKSSAGGGADAGLRSAFAEAQRLHRAGQLAAAERRYRDVLRIDGAHVEALHWLGVTLSQRGDQLAALRAFQQALGMRPGFAASATAVAHALLLMGRAEDAVIAADKALAIAPTPQAKTLFAQALLLSQDAPRISAVRATVARAIAERWARPADMARIASRLALAAGRIDPEDPVLLALLAAAPVCTMELEHALTQARRALLQRASEGHADDETIAFHAALAQQCFINEDVFAPGVDELAQVVALRDRLAAGMPSSALQLIAVAAYFPLHGIEGASTLLAQDWPGPVERLLVQQIEEPLAERKLRATIRQLTPISGAVSRAVQDQYEQNPYPRWTTSVGTTAAQTAPFDALVAGCGTGRQSAELAQRYPAARVLAVDLSLTSLCYALRMTQAQRLTNIEYAQADIMALGGIGRSFDLIEANGVLHHLADPWAGWRVLLDLLRPGGRMRIGLYSEIARGPVVAARAFIAARGYAASADDIRRFRQDVPAEPSLAMLTQSRDFFTVSGCRDLLFHAQEHRTRLPQIKAFLAGNGLTFRGFELDAATLHAYQRRFPDDRERLDLDRWDAFERENPHAFVRMYQFSVTKD
jgi:SAM-dependent methyltransferase/tetratricopeptide (TPR) repeat protein